MCQHFLQKRLKVPTDAALCAILAGFFGIGTAIASHIQFSHPQSYRQIAAYLYGQSATMTDLHVFVFGSFSLIVMLFLIVFHKELRALSFDKNFSQTQGIPSRLIDGILWVLIIFSIVLGIRCVGVVLMSAMLIAPAVAARQFTSKLSSLLICSAIVGLLSGYFGTVFSTLLFVSDGGDKYLPTGPLIVLIASFFAGISLVFAPERGLFARFVRIKRFHLKRAQENLIKAIWRHPTALSFAQLSSAVSDHRVILFFWILILRVKGWVKKEKQNALGLTEKGKREATRIVRLHRLWEVYLVSHLGEKVDGVHEAAEEMEHVLTPELERQMAHFLDHPLHDPHDQPIPPSEEVPSHG